MKKLLCLILIVCLAPSLCLSETAVPFNSIWGIKPDMTIFEVVELVQKTTEMKISPFLSEDEAEIYYFASDYEESIRFLDFIVDSILIMPRNRPFSVNDKDAEWSVVAISFEQDSAIDSFGTLYRTLCDAFGEPSSQTFSVEKLGIDGMAIRNLDFPYSESYDAQSVRDAVSEGKSCAVEAAWNNIRLRLSSFEGSVSSPTIFVGNSAQ